MTAKARREKYVGIKYQAIMNTHLALTPKEKTIIKELIAIGKTIGKMGIKDLNGGNVSYWTGENMLIKRTGAHPYELKVKDFVRVTKVTPTQVFSDGESEPSSEARLHWYSFKARPDIKCIFHCHDFTVVYSPIKLTGVGYIPEIPYGTMESARAIARGAKKYDYLVMANHGVIAFGKTINQTIRLIQKHHDQIQKLES